MNQHREVYAVRMTVIVPAPGDTLGAWDACPSLPTTLAEEEVRSCSELYVVVSTYGDLVARLIGQILPHQAFRVLARERDTHTLAGSVEWIRSAETGLWHQWDEPWTACQHGQHTPSIRLAA
ncbi:hypothetical protein ACFZB6_26585 [Streptomyces syringium]|uniref:hypothetical protein n=1 Tax=Streptomyces syringium TaxID=76729 RepID=UPI0036E0B9DF